MVNVPFPLLRYNRSVFNAEPSFTFGLNWIGVVVPVGKLTPEQMRGLALVSRDFGDGDVRLTVWQNLMISGVPDDKITLAKIAIEALGLSIEPNSIRAGLVACTGSTGCRFAAAHTKENAVEIAAWCEKRVALDMPVNIHLTGCHHSCAQHYIGDIGLIGARIAVGEESDTVDGYHLHVGGGRRRVPRRVVVDEDECCR